MTIRVAQLCPQSAPALGLAERLRRWSTISDVAEATAAAGAEVSVLLDGPPERLMRGGVEYRQIPGLARPSWRDPLTPRAASAIRALDPQVLHIAGLEFPVFTRAVSRLGLPVFVQDHASRPRARGAALWRWGLAGIDGVSFTAAAQAESFVRARQLPRSARIFAIPESSSHFVPGNQADARSRTGIDGAPALLWVGHLDANKNPLMALRAVRQALRHLPGLKLWCAFSEAPLRADIESMLAGDPELAARVQLLGRIPHDRMEALYRACDGFLSASYREGSGYALIEALACGLPAIVTDIPSFREITGGGSVGALVAVDDDAAMSEAILRLFAGTAWQDGERRGRIRDHFDAHLSFGVIGARLIEAYAALAARGAPCASR